MIKLTQADKLSITISSFPPMIREALCADESFMQNIGTRLSNQIVFSQHNVSFDSAELFDKVSLLQTQPHSSIKGSDNQHWNVTLHSETDFIQLSNGSTVLYLDVFSLPAFVWDKRKWVIEKFCLENYLSVSETVIWVSELNDQNISPQSMFRFQEALRNHPKYIQNSIKEDIASGKSTFDKLAPKNPQYYIGLIGEYANSTNITEYANNEFRLHIQYLIKAKAWDLIASLLHHSSLCNALNEFISDEVSKELGEAYKLDNPAHLVSWIENDFWTKNHKNFKQHIDNFSNRTGSASLN